MNTETTLANVYKVHKAELERLKENHSRELNAKLAQINKQAETIRDERQRREQAEHWLGELLAVIHYQSEHGIEKAAKDAIEKRNQLIARIDVLEHQFISALAAIEKHNNSLYVRSGLGAKINVDLSLLHERDAEVRKPLVDVLKAIENANCGHDLGKCRSIARDALAKVRESK